MLEIAHTNIQTIFSELQVNSDIYLERVLGTNTNSIFDSLVIALVISILAIVLKKFVLSKAQKFVNKTKNHTDNSIFNSFKETDRGLHLVILAFVSAKMAGLDGIIEQIIDVLTLVFVTHQILKFTPAFTTFILHKEGSNQPVEPTLRNFLSSLLKTIVWIGVVIAALEIFNYNIGVLVTSLGIGGLIIALALQNVVADLFGSLGIYFDKPFKVGDYVEIGSDGGTVKEIGLKSTRFVTLQGQELVISNKELSEVRINNYKKLKRRRIEFNIGVVYNTSKTKLELIPNLVSDIFNKIDLVDLNKCRFIEFGDYSLKFKIIYYVNNSSRAMYFDKQAEINMAIVEEFENSNIEFAFPTQTIIMKK